MAGRVSKWRRQKNAERIILQPRDREIMVAVHAFRVISREQIGWLFGFNSPRRLNIRLRKLYDHKYLSRLFVPTVRGSAKAVYYLGPKGMNIVAAELGQDPHDLKKKRQAITGLKELFLAHALELNNIRIAFSQAVVQDPEMKFERWINDYDCAQNFHDGHSGKQKRFRPDGYFRLTSGNKLYSFFLEFDRSTMTGKRFQKKVETYLEFARLDYYRQRFGVKYFRVLVITPNTERQENLKKAVEEITNRIFWFATRDKIRRETVFKPIWKRAGHEGRFRLI
jgi:hypothetical protein